jgi:hypothetical protein
MRMGLILRLVETGIDGSSRSVDVLEIVRPDDLGDLADLGLSLAADLPVLRGTVPGQGLPPPPDCNLVRPSHAPAATFPLCQVR